MDQEVKQDFFDVFSLVVALDGVALMPSGGGAHSKLVSSAPAGSDLSPRSFHRVRIIGGWRRFNCSVLVIVLMRDGISAWLRKRNVLSAEAS